MSSLATSARSALLTVVVVPVAVVLTAINAARYLRDQDRRRKVAAQTQFQAWIERTFFEQAEEQFR